MERSLKPTDKMDPFDFPSGCSINSGEVEGLVPMQRSSFGRARPYTGTRANDVGCSEPPPKKYKNGVLRTLKGRRVRGRQKRKEVAEGGLLMRLGDDTMALLLSFLEVFDAYRLLTWPLSKTYRKMFCESVYLWQQLCIGNPFRCNPKTPPLVMLGNVHTDKFCLARGQYMSFMKCKQYVEKLTAGTFEDLIANEEVTQDALNDGNHNILSAQKKVAPAMQQEENLRESAITSNGMSELTKRLLGIGGRQKGEESNLQFWQPIQTDKDILASNLLTIKTKFDALPWTSPLYTLVNWLKFYRHVEGIVALCLSVLPSVLEDRDVRVKAWGNGINLPDIVFDFMLNFPDNARINMAAMHNFVVLARPIGSREGSLFHSRSMRQSLSAGDELVVSEKGRKGRHGVYIIFDAMDRFWDHSGVMSMACWSLVNISLVDRHKVIMLQLGAVQKVLAAIRKHPDCQEVVYRALFCLVNFVVPAGATNNQSQGTSSAAVSVHMNLSVKPASVGGQLEDILKTTIFCIFKWIHNTDIISRATLIFHNLSVIENSERALLLTPGCLSALRLINNSYRNYGRITRITECIIHGLYEATRNDTKLELEYLEMIKRTRESKLRK